MIRQAHTYLVGALSGTVLIGAAIAVFVVLVSAQVFTDWPASFGQGAPQKTEVSDARAVVHSPLTAPRPNAGAKALAAARPGGKAHAHANAGNDGSDAGRRAVDTHVSTATPDPTVSGESPGSGGKSTGGSDRSESGAPGHSPGSPTHSRSPAPTQPTPAPTPTPTSGGGGGKGGGSGGGGETGGPTGGPESTPTPTPVPVPPTSKTVTETVNKVVSGVDETVTGGTLQETGVTHVTEEVVNGVAGPESVVGKTVDGVGEAVGGLLGGGK